MEEWLAEEKQETLEKVAEYFTKKKTAAAAEDGGDNSVRSPLVGGSLQSKRTVAVRNRRHLRSRKRKVNDCDSKGVIKKQKVAVNRTGPKFKRPIDFRLFKTAADLEILGMRRLRSELEYRGLRFKGTLQERAKELFDNRLDFPTDDDVWWWSLGLQPNLYSEL